MSNLSNPNSNSSMNERRKLQPISLHIYMELGLNTQRKLLSLPLTITTAITTSLLLLLYLL